MLDKLPRIKRQIVHAADADGQFAHRPGIGERNDSQSPWSWQPGARSSPARSRCRPCIRPAGTRRRSCATGRAAATAGRCASPCWQGSAARRWRDRGRRSRARAPRRSRPSPVPPEDGRAQRRARSGRGGTERSPARRASTVPATMPRSATPSAIRPTISSLSRSSRSTLTFGWRRKKRAERFRKELGQRVGIRQDADLAGEAAAIGAEVFVQALGLPQDRARMLQQRAAGLRRGNALAPARDQRDAERLFHVADARRGGGERQVRALRAVGDAARFDDMAKQAEIGEIESHGMMLPSYLTKPDFAIMPIALAYFNANISHIREVERRARS